MKKYVVLGGYGIIGKVVTADLAKFKGKDDEIIVASRDMKKDKEFVKSLKNKKVIAKKVDIKNKNELVELLKGKDVCVNCVQYYFNVDIMKACLKAGIGYCDLGGMFHMTRKQLMLDREFRKKGISAILGIGAAPGISNMLAKYAGDKIRKVKDIDIVFADIDKTKYNQKFVLPYSFKTLVEEFTEKPMVFRNGKTFSVEARSGTKEYNFGKEFGKQKGFLTLHSEIATLPDYFKDKGIGKCEFRVTFPDEFTETMQMLIDLGFTSNQEVELRENKMNILNVSSEIMDKLVPKKGTKIKGKEIVRVIINGNHMIDGVTISDRKTNAGVLDTGIPCSIVAQMIADGKIKNGVNSPESAIDSIEFFKELSKRKMFVYENGKKLN